MDNDLDTDEGDLDWDEQSLEDAGAIDFNLNSSDPNSDEVTMLKNSLEKMYTCQNHIYTQLVNNVGVNYQTNIQNAVEKYNRWIDEFKSKVKEVLENNNIGGGIEVQVN